VAVQGVGQTGTGLIALLAEQGATIFAADINESALEKMVTDHGVTAVATDTIHAQDVDIFIPCALGGIINDQTIPELKCSAIVGLANNQLQRPEHGQVLLDKNIAYVPDFIVNAGGMIGCSLPIFSKPNKEESLKRIKSIYDVSLQILQQSKDTGVHSEAIAEAIALERINLTKTLKKTHSRTIV